MSVADTIRIRLSDHTPLQVALATLSHFNEDRLRTSYPFEHSLPAELDLDLLDARLCTLMETERQLVDTWGSRELEEEGGNE